MKDFEDYVTGLRREFHRHPELSGQEAWTSARIGQELTALGIPWETAGDKNVIGRIENRTGPAIALRADFDALPLEELTDVPWKSEISGVMHACGHDAHAAWLLGAAKLLAEDRASWKGTVFLCFQQGEESGLGAADCVEYLQAHGGVDAVFAAHIMPILPSGTLDLAAGVRMTGGYTFHIDIAGQGGHGARPDAAVSAAEIAADLYGQLIRIPANHHEAARTCVVSPCVLHAGTRFNVIPESGYLEGTIRFMGENDGQELKQKVARTAEAVAALHGGRAETRFEVMSEYPVINDAACVETGKAAAQRTGLSVCTVPPSTASDNYGDFLHAFPGFYAFLGARSSREGTSPVNHNQRFDIDEAVLPKAARFFFECIRLTAGRSED